MSADDPTTFAEAVALALATAGKYNRNDKVAPVAIIWPDPDNAWAPLLLSLRSIAPVAVLGDYDAELRTGPGIYLRYLVDDIFKSPEEVGTPVIYLPGVDRSAMRAVEGCDPRLRAIVELQFRATWWQQPNGMPWTPAAFLRSREGLGLEVGRDDATTQALSRSLISLADVPLEDLKRRGRIDASFLNSLVNSDEVKLLLQWLDAPSVTRDCLSQYEWESLVSQVREMFGVDLEADGELVVAEKLGMSDGEWKRVWTRYADSPRMYPRLPELLRRARPDALFVGPVDSWPQDNEAAEGRLRTSLRAISSEAAAGTRTLIYELAEENRSRLGSVWAALGQAPLAAAVELLARLAASTDSLPVAASVDEFATWYRNSGWKVDALAVAALAAATGPSDRAAVTEAVRALYLPWLDDVARRFQDVATTAGYDPDVGLSVRDGDCVLFVDGLRYDVGEGLRLELAQRGLDAHVTSRLAPFPTVTSTGKPAVMPMTGSLVGGEGMSVKTSAGKAVSAEVLRALMRSSGVKPFPDGENGEPTGRGWTEAADLDATGHKLGLKLVDSIPREISDLASRVHDLLTAGWKRVLIVTDHGWLLMPGGLPKIELPQHLTEPRQRRCARLASGALDVSQPVVPWSWDRSVRMASPRGAGVFDLGEEYVHGGLSPQECVTPMLTVATGSSSVAFGRIELVKWIGMRCRVDVVGAPAGCTLDLRRNPGDATSSLVAQPKAVAGDEEVKLLVHDNELEGTDCFAVLLSAQGEILAQVSTRVRG
ncbi:MULTISPECIES: BREX-1 system phosphatase PglZ type B [unclassified Rhodococcus (in: high G+C Gram-positive bacteria)]|uniref:BREX-1 system phosphatase PglZ type B n=1 Tax=unclassified Rhodococcus (in: high G+C Gram-positive bacteria) TaxID=192944 RepID=UPI000A5B4B75|nr:MULTISPECIES: BREX-1 system phosphatase PglZ type B [unclassified Rhodococcus (in: high G+C Gram-positive bacteria)]